MIEKILERLEERAEYLKVVMKDACEKGYMLSSEKAMNELIGIKYAKAIVQEVAKEYGNGWIPVEVAMPEEHESIFAKFKGTDDWDEAMFEKLSDDVSATIEFINGTRKTKVLYTVDGKWTDGVNSSWNVIAWQPLPAPYQKGE